MQVRAAYRVGVDVSKVVGLNDVTQVNGKAVRLPYENSAFRIERRDHDVIYMAVNGFVVRSSGRRVTVTAPGQYRQHVCGLCGNFDGSSVNDWITSTGWNALRSRDPGRAIGDSWIVNRQAGQM